MGLGTHVETLTVGSWLIQRNVEKTADNEVHHGGAASPITLTPGKTVTSWVKTDADTAACDLPASHGQTDGKFDVYDSTGAIIRYGVDGTIVANALSLDGGTGSDFPESATVGIVVCKQQQVNISIDGDLAEMVGFLSTVSAHCECQDASADVIRAFSLDPGEPDMWDSEEATNPYTGDPITKVLVSNGTPGWVTSTSYAIGDQVVETAVVYECLVAHTSGTFATDLAAADWEVISPTLEALILQDSTP
jgi:hypothetical protein